MMYGSRFFAIVLLLCFIQLVSATHVDRSASSVAVANHKAEMAYITNAALTSRNTPLAALVVVAISSLVASLAWATIADEGWRVEIGDVSELQITL